MSTSVCFLVDGFNVYHAIRETRGRTGTDCRWLDLHSLCSSSLHLIDPTARIEEIHYFSALADHLERSRPGTVARHERYIEALRATRVIPHLGVFKPKEVRYHSRSCEVLLRRHEEKETDVAIAAMIVESGDTDLLPAHKTARRLRPTLGIYCLFPPYRANRAFRAHVDADFKMSPGKLPEHLLKNPVVAADGRAIAKPAGW